MDATSVRAATVHEANPFLAAAGAGESLEWDLGVSNRDGVASLHIEAFDLEKLADVLDIDVKVLHLPVRVFVALGAHCGAPVLEDAGMQVHHGVHLVEGATGLVLEVSFDEVEAKEASLRDHTCKIFL